MSTRHDLNTALLDVLGVDWRGMDVVGVTLRLRGHKPPTLTVHRQLNHGTPLDEMVERFELTPIGKVEPTVAVDPGSPAGDMTSVSLWPPCTCLTGQLGPDCCERHSP